ncbi:MAG TPA: hypothetical protein DCE24_07270 [Porphyromonadaceae bacterium]|nr:glycosyltransferase family 52 [Prevotella sp.]HAB41638.1 hypothetical protein [Porphyromonadaceae bacterium]
MNLKLSEIRSVGIFGSVYSLFLYLLIKSEEEINKTFFFLATNIPEIIRKNIQNKVVIDNNFGKDGMVKRFLRKLILIFKRYTVWRFIDNAEIFGHDHLEFSPILIQNKEINIVEDGIGNYYIHDYAVPKTTGIRKLITRIYGKMTFEPKFGRSQLVKKVYLTGILPVLSELKAKEIHINVKELWKNSTSKKRQFIFQIFNVDEDEIKVAIGKKVLLLTQPYNEIIPSSELINIYRNALQEYEKKDVLIKTHPRDTIDYITEFKGYHVLRSPIPMELLGMLGFNFDVAITISSSAIYSLPGNTQKKILGHECHPDLLRILGPLSFNNKK